MFSLSPAPIDSAALTGRLKRPDAGAFVSFEGWVRDHNHGKKVLRLEYEAYAALAEKEGGRILEEAGKKYDTLAASCVHRVGPLGLGETAVWVGVVSRHRPAAFEACRYVIDEIKRRLPVWKKEYYGTGDSGWVDCAH